jgi:hypothetical protein
MWVCHVSLGSFAGLPQFIRSMWGTPIGEEIEHGDVLAVRLDIRVQTPSTLYEHATVYLDLISDTSSVNNCKT